MRILFIARGPSPYRVAFFNELGKMCNLTVLFEMEPKEINDRELIWFNENYINFNAIYLKKKQKIKNDNFCPEVVRYLRKDDYDYIIIGMYSTPTQMLAIQYLKFKHISYVLSSDGGFIKNENIFTRLIKKHFISGADIYFSSGLWTSKYLQHYGAKENIYIYPFTTIETESLPHKLNEEEKKKLKLKLGMVAEHKIILGVGQFVKRKGFDILIKVAKKFPDYIDVYIIGGNAPKEYNDLKGDCNRIHFIDFKKKNELEKYYRVADLFVLPTREDIWGLVINEAMSYGIPVITTNKCLAGLELIENDVNGYIVDVDMPDILLEKALKIIENPNIHKYMSEQNIKKMQHYTIKEMAKAYFEALFNEGNNNEKL